MLRSYAIREYYYRLNISVHKINLREKYIFLFGKAFNDKRNEHSTALNYFNSAITLTYITLRTF